MKKAIAVTLLSCLVIACWPATGNPVPHLGAIEPVSWTLDLDGSTMVRQIVTGIEGNGIAPPPAGTAAALDWDGGALYWGTGGSGVSPGDGGQWLVTNDAGTATQWVYPIGDVTTVGGNPGSLYVASISGSAGGGGTVPLLAGAYLGLSGSSTLPTIGSLRTSDHAGSGVDILGIEYSGTSYVAISQTGNALQIGTGHALGNGVGTLNLYAGSGGAVAIGRGSGTDIFDNAGILYLGTYATAATPLVYNFTTTTTPTLLSGTSATSFGIGSNKSGAELDMYADADIKVLAMLLASATFQSGVNVIVTAAHEDISSAAAPSAPASGTKRIYTDSADNKLKAIDSAGNVYELTP